MSNKPVFLTLNNNKDRLTSVPSIVKALLLYAIESPGWTSSYFTEESISLRSILAKHENDPDSLARIFQDDLTSVINRYFPTESLSVEITNSDQDDSGFYKLKIGIKYPSGDYVVSLKDVGILKGKVVSY